MRAGNQLFEAGYQSLFDGWRQAQEFWNGVARTWGGAAGGMLGQNAQPMGQNMDVLRELNEAALSVAQAWMRLPMVLMGGAQPNELQEATTRLTQAQGRAYQLWLEALSRTGQTVSNVATQGAREAGQAARDVERETRR
jgi:hypothetical protein